MYICESLKVPLIGILVIIGISYSYTYRTPESGKKVLTNWLNIMNYKKKKIAIPYPAVFFHLSFRSMLFFLSFLEKHLRFVFISYISLCVGLAFNDLCSLLRIFL